MSNELKSHSEVLNNEPRTLIIGHGWVGRFIESYFTQADIFDSKGYKKRKLKEYDLAFICVPTPMKGDGSCHTDIVERSIQNFKDVVKYFCIKSTIPVGFVEEMEEKYGVNICFSPEYVGETLGHPLVEAKRDTFIILGGRKEVTTPVAEYWTLVTNSYAKIYQVDARTAELCKLMENSFIATKVMFMNEFYEIASSLDIDFQDLRQIFLADPRVSPSHTYVYKDNRGFAGKCLPKDINNLVHTFPKQAKLMKFLLKYNEEMRKK